VYLTTNIINKKFYVGVHSTYNKNDKYLGSGDKLKLAIKKYGRENFTRTILHYCLTAEHAYEIESQIVNKSFIKRTDTYNISIGGFKPPSAIGRKVVVTEKTRAKMSVNHADFSGTKSSTAKQYLCIFPDGSEKIIHGELRKFLKEHDITVSIFYNFVDKGKINRPLLRQHSKQTIKRLEYTNGFEFRTIVSFSLS
jgi:hypothetical protein